MHTALYVTGFGALIFGAITFYFYRAADRPGDDFGAAIPALLSVGVTGLLALAWIILIVIKAANA